MRVHIYTCTLAVGSAPLNTLVLWSSYHRDIQLFGALFALFLMLYFSPTFLLALNLFLSYNSAAVSGYTD